MFVSILKDMADWSEWSKCSNSCGSGIQTRTQNCNGDNCEGSQTEEKSCFNLRVKKNLEKFPQVISVTKVISLIVFYS